MRKNFWILIILAVFLLGLTNFSYALPQGESVESGSASFNSPDPSTYNIAASDRSVINFQSFNIASGETVHVSSNDQALNPSMLLRDQGNAASLINGNLLAPGITLFLINTAGIYIGPDGNIQANNFVASTLDISTNNFINQRYIFEHDPQKIYSQILNKGKITADNVALIASSVDNQGLIIAQAGTAALASGDKTTVSFDARGLIQIEVTVETSGQVVSLEDGSTVLDAVANSGTIEARNVIMTAKTAQDIFEFAVNQSGVVAATGIVEENGTIRITANRNIKVSGTLEAPQGNIVIQTDESVIIPDTLNLTGLATITADTISGGLIASGSGLTLKAESIDLSASVPQLTYWHNADNLHLTASTLADDVVTLEGEGVFLVYPRTSDFTLRSNNQITTEPGVILQAGTVQLISNKFGTQANPLYIQADSTYIQRLNGTLDIAYSQVFGDQVLVRGPPEDDFAIVYPQSSNLVLEAARITLSEGASLEAKTLTLRADQEIDISGSLIAYADINVYGTTEHIYAYATSVIVSETGSINLETTTGHIYVRGIVSAPNGTLRFWTSTHLDLVGSTRVSKDGPYAYIWNPEDGQAYAAVQSGNWNDPATWGAPTYPGQLASDDTVTIGSNYSVTLNIDVTIASLTLSSSGTFTQQGDLTINGNFSQTAGTFTCTDPVNYTMTVTGNFTIPSTPGAFRRASGTDPNYTIYDLFGLQSIKCWLGKNFTLGADIDASETSGWTGFDSGGFTPIGYGIGNYTGTFDGDNHTISNLYINGEDYSNIGLFSIIASPATIQGVGLINVNIWGAGNTGGLVGQMQSGTTISRCYVTGTINTTGDLGTGGFVGYINGTNITISYCYSTADITGGQYFVGGFVGRVDSSSPNQATVSNSYATGDVSGGDYRGGFVASNISGVFINCYATGNMSGSGNSIGGFVGADDDSGEHYTNCFATGDVPAGQGGFSGYEYSGLYTNCWYYNIGNAMDPGITKDPVGKASFYNSSHSVYTGTPVWTFNATNWDNAGNTTYPYLTDHVWVWTSAGDGATWSDPLNWNKQVAYPLNNYCNVLIDNTNDNIATPAGASLTVGVLTLGSAYSGTLTLGNDLILDDTNLSGNLTINAGTLAPNSKNITIDGTFNVAGTFTPANGTVTMNNGSSIANAGTLTFNNLTIANAASVTSSGSFSVAGSFNTGNASSVFTPGAADFIFGAGTLTGSGTVKVTRNSSDALNSQYTLLITSANLTFDYTGGASQTISNTTYNNLTISGSISTGTNTAIVAGVFNVSGTFTPSAGTISMDNGSSITNSGTLTFFNLTIFEYGSVATSSSFSIAGTLTLNSEASFIPSVGTVTFNNGASIVNNNDGILGFNNLTIANSASVSSNGSFSVAGSFNTGNASSVFTPGAADVISGAGTLTGSGTVKVTRTAATADFDSQYTITNKSLINMTVDYAGAGQILSDREYGNLKISGSILTGTNNAYVYGTINVTGTFTPSAGAINTEGSSISNSGTLVFYTLTIVDGATVTTASSFEVADTLSIGDGSTLTASNGTITFNNGAIIDNNSGTLVFYNIAVANSATVSTSSSFSIAGTTTVGTDSTFTISGVLSGAYNLVKAGAGTLTLSGTNTYTGSTTINGGTISIAADAGLGTAPGSATPGHLTFNGGTLATTATLTLNSNRGIALTGAGTLSPSAALTYNGIIAGSGSLTKEGSAGLILGGVNTYTGATYLNAGQLRIAADSAFGTAPGSPTEDMIVFDGGSLRTTATFTLDSNRGITLNAGGGLFVVAGSTTLTYGGIIQGTGALTKAAQSGTLELTGTNTYSGGTTISAGNIIFSNGSLGSSGNITFTAGGLQYASGNTEDISSRIKNSTSYIYVDTGSNDVTWAGVIDSSNTAGISKFAGSGTLTLSAVNTYTGVTWVYVGAINIQNSSACSNTSVAAADGAAIKLEGGVTISNTLTLNGTGVSTDGALRNISGDNAWTGAITLGSATRINSDAGTLTISTGGITGATYGLTVGGAGNVTISAVIGTTSGTLTKDGAGTLTLSGANTYTGLTTVSAGVMNVRNNSALGTTDSGTTVVSGAALELQGGVTVTGETLSLSGYGVVSTTGALRNISGDNEWTGDITLGAITAIYSDAGTLTVSGNIINGSNNLMLGNSGDMIVSGVIGNGSGTLNKYGTGTLTLSGANTYTGGITNIAAGGTLKLGASNVIPDTANPSIWGILDLNGYSDTIGYFGGTGMVTNSSVDPAVLTTNSPAFFTFQGTIQDGTGTVSLVKAGSGNMTLTGANTYTGSTTVSAGILIGGAANVFGGANSTSALVMDGGILDMGGYNQAFGSLTGTGTIDNSTGSSTYTLTIGYDNTSPAAYSGVIQNTSGSIALAKSGSGTLILSGNNTYTGTTTVSAGVLNIQHTNALGTTAAGTSVTAGAALQMQGGITVTGEALTLNGTGVSSDGALRNISGNNEWTGAITLGSATRINSDAGTLTISTGGITGATYDLTIGGAGNTTISAVIGTTSGTLTKDGAGTLILSGANTYTGTTTINVGRLLLGTNAPSGSPGALGNATSAVLLGNTSGSSDAYLLTNGAYTVGRDISLQSGNSGVMYIGGNTADSSVFSGAISASRSLTAYITDNGSVTFSGNITLSGGNGITIGGSGTRTLTLSGSNSFSFPLSISSGMTLNINSANALGGTSLIVQGGTIDNTSGGPITSASGITAWLASFAFGGTNPLTLGGAITMTGMPTTYTITANGLNALTLSGSISGSGFSLTKDGTGTLILSGSNSYTGTTTVSAGVLNIQNVSALGTGAVSVTAGACLQAQGGISVGNALTLNGTGVSTDGALRNISGDNTWTGAITLGSATRINSDSGTLTISTGGITGATYGLTVGGSGNTTISAVIGTTSGTLTKDGAGTLTLSGDNTYTGTTTISNGTLSASDIVVAAGSSNLGNASSAVVLGDGSNKGTLSYTGNTAEYIRGFTVNAGGGEIDVTTAGQTLTISTVGITAGGALTIGGVGNTTISSVISSTGSLTKEGAGTLTLSAANTFTGLTTVSAGVLNIQNASALGTTAGGTSVTSGAALQIQGGITITGEALTLNGTGVSTDGALRNISGDNTWTGAITLGSATRINSDSGTLTISTGGITGATYGLTVGGAGNVTISAVIGTTSGTLTKDGAGTLTLSAANTFTGGVTLNAGQLNINNNSGLGSGTFTINGGSIDNTTASLKTLANPQIWNGDFTIVGSGAFGFIFSAGGSVTLGGNITVTCSGSAPAVYSVISDSGNGYSLTKTGSGALQLNGANTFTGGTTLSVGTLLIMNNSALGTGTFTINGGDIGATGKTITNDQIWNGDFSYTYASTLTFQTGTITLGANCQITVSNSSGILVVDGIIGDSGSGYGITKAGSGKLTLSAANTFTGGVTLNAGTLNINNSQALGTVAGTFTIAGGTIDNTSGSAITLTANNPLVFNADFTFSGTSSLNLGTGAITLSASRQVTVSANTLTVGGILSAASYDLTKAGAGTLTLNGTTTLNDLTISAGTLATTSATFNISGNWTNNASSTAFSPGSGTVIFNGTDQAISGSNTFNNLTKTTSSACTLTFEASSTQTITGTLTLQGAADELLSLRSSSEGTYWRIDPQGTRTISYLDVKDSNNINATAIETAGLHITNSGHNNGWIFVVPGNTYTWIGVVSSDWDDGSNWDLGAAPSSSANDVIIPAGTSFSPVLSGSISIHNLTLSDTLDVASYSLTLGGDLTGSGILLGVNPSVSASGYIGTRSNPVQTNITGTLALHAGSKLNDVSISVSGTGTYSVTEPVPGFVFFNGRLQQNTGQNDIRQQLETGGSSLYRGLPDTTMNLLPPVMPLMTPSFVPLALPAGAVLVPVMLPQPAMTGFVVPTLPAPPAQPSTPFTGIQAITAVPLEQPPAFTGAAAQATLPVAATPQAFQGITTRGLLPEELFKQASAIVTLSPGSLTKESFAAATSSVALPQALPESAFAGSSVATQLPVSAQEALQAVHTSVFVSPARKSADAFTRILSSSELTQPVFPEFFTGIITRIQLEQPVSRDTFIGATAGTFLPQTESHPSFEGIISTQTLEKPPSDASVFEKVGTEVQVRVMFPSGNLVKPHYYFGIPMGAERPLVEPRISDGGKPESAEDRR